MGISEQRLESVKQDFLKLIKNGMTKHNALNKICDDNKKEINTLWLRNKFYYFGWLI